MEWTELTETVKKLRDAMKRENGGRVDEHPSFDEMAKLNQWYTLFLALENFIDTEI